MGQIYIHEFQSEQDEDDLSEQFKLVCDETPPPGCNENAFFDILVNVEDAMQEEARDIILNKLLRGQFVDQLKARIKGGREQSKSDKATATENEAQAAAKIVTEEAKASITVTEEGKAPSTVTEEAKAA